MSDQSNVVVFKPRYSDVAFLHQPPEKVVQKPEPQPQIDVHWMKPNVPADQLD